MFELFITYFYIGLTTFGGGYAMIPIIRDIIVEKKKWITNDELMEIFSIAEVTPGPVAINMATYIGYKKGKLLGSILATLGCVLPSLIVITIVSFFYEAFISNVYVQYAFVGIKSAVAFLIISNALKLMKGLEKRPIWFVLFIVVFVTFMIFQVFSIKVSSIYFIIVGIIVGLLVYVFSNKKKEEIK